MTESEPDKLLQFPCSFPIKMMGRADAAFSNTAVGLVERHVGKVTADAIQTSQSRNGNFLSVTVTIDAKSQKISVPALRALEQNPSGSFWQRTRDGVSLWFE